MAVTINFKPKSFVDPIHCDKISITFGVNVGEPDQINAALEQLQADGHAKPARLSKQSMYRKNIKVLLGVCIDQTLLVQAHPKKPGMSYLRFEWNPSKNDMSEVAAYMNFLIPSGGYERLTKSGTVTRLDLAIDIHYASLSRLLFTQPMIRATSAHWKNGRTQTLYMGDETSPRRFCIYDKTAHLMQLKSKTVAPPIGAGLTNHPITRIEVRLKKRIPMSALAKLENPFAQLEVARPSSIYPKDDTWAMFLKAAQIIGAQTMLVGLSEATQKHFKERLKAGQAPWWKPHKLWKDWPAAANTILYPIASFSLGAPKSSTSNGLIDNAYGQSTALH